MNNTLSSFCWWHVKAIQGFFQGDLYRDRDETLCQVQCESIRRPSLFVLLHLPSSSSWLSSSSCLLPKPVLLSWGCFPRRAKGIVCPKSGSPTTPSLPSLQHVKSEYPVLHSSPLRLSSTSSSWNLNKVFHWGFILQSTIRRGDDPFQVESKYSGTLQVWMPWSWNPLFVILLNVTATIAIVIVIVIAIIPIVWPLPLPLSTCGRCSMIKYT